MPAEPSPILGDVSRETQARLEQFADLVRKWSPRINLVSRNDLDDLWSRHVVDSAQLLSLAPENAENWVDLGSGGGFPGAVIAILAAETRPRLGVTCVEADQRKAAFLRTVSRETSTRLAVRDERVEALPGLNADILSARALASLDVLLSHAMRHLRPGGIALFPKGARHEEELAAARNRWRFDGEAIRSETNPNAVILKLGEISRV